MRSMVDAITVCEKEKLTKLCWMMHGLKPVEVKKLQKGKKRKGPDHNCSQTLEENDEEGRAAIARKETPMATDSLQKRKRRKPRKQQ